VIQKRILFVTVAIWLVLVIGLAYWYIVIGAGWTPVDAEYEQWKDYRLAFFVIRWLPFLVLALGVVLLIEIKMSRKKR